MLVRICVVLHVLCILYAAAENVNLNPMEDEDGLDPLDYHFLNGRFEGINTAWNNIDHGIEEELGFPEQMTDADIKNDIYLGRKHGVVEEVDEPQQITDADIKNDVDLGRKHGAIEKVDQPQQMTDADIKNDVDLGRKHGAVEEVDEPQQITDADIKNDVDLGRKHSTHEELGNTISPSTENSDNQKGTDHGLAFGHPVESINRNEPTITYADIKNDIDLGLKEHTDHEEPLPSFHELHAAFIKGLESRRHDKRLRPRPSRLPNPDDTKSDVTVTHQIHMKNSKKVTKYHDSRNDQKATNAMDAPELVEMKQSSYEPVHKDMCRQYDVDGCSIPFGAPFFFKELFTNSCDRHDICYGCGVRFGFKRVDCDYAFKDNMWQACVGKYVGEVATDTISREHGDRVIKAMESLRTLFAAIFEDDIGPGIDKLPAEGPKRREGFLKLIQLVQRNVTKRWAVELTRVLQTKYKNNFPRRKSVPSFQYDKKALREVKENMNLEYDVNLTTDLCEDVLKYVDEKTGAAGHGIKLSCKEIELLTCNFFDHVYFLAVRVFAGYFYHHTPESYCGKPFVRKCLPPIPHY